MALNPTLTTVLGALAAVAVAGCGGDDKATPSEPPEKVVAQYYAAAGDPTVRCDTLAGAELQQFGGVEQCRQAIQPSPNDPPQVRTRASRIEGDKACVRFELKPGGEAIALLGNHDGAWKIEAFDVAGEAQKPGALPCKGEESDEEREAEGRGKSPQERERERERGE
jgi:hypothetical protein